MQTINIIYGNIKLKVSEMQHAHLREKYSSVLFVRKNIEIFGHYWSILQGLW